MFKKNTRHDKNSGPVIFSPEAQGEPRRKWPSYKLSDTRKGAKPQKTNCFCNYIILVYCLHPVNKRELENHFKKLLPNFILCHI